MMKTQKNIKRYLPDVNKNLVWGIAGLAGLAALIYFLGKRSGTIEQFHIPGEPGSSPLTDEEQRQVAQITTELYSNLGTSWNWLINWDIVQLNNYLKQSDRIFIGVYNLYNKTYLSVPDTLKTEIASEMRFALAFTDDYKVMEQIVNRMNTLGMK